MSSSFLLLKNGIQTARLCRSIVKVYCSVTHNQIQTSEKSGDRPQYSQFAGQIFRFFGFSSGGPGVVGGTFPKMQKSFKYHRPPTSTAINIRHRWLCLLEMPPSPLLLPSPFGPFGGPHTNFFDPKCNQKMAVCFAIFDLWLGSYELVFGHRFSATVNKRLQNFQAVRSLVLRF